MRTAGIDLATKPTNTAVCVVDWSGSEAVVTFARRPRLGRPERPNRRVAEVSPAASLCTWQFDYKAYKKPKAAEKRRELLDLLAKEMQTLVWRDGARDRCVASDHAFDALVCAITTRAVSTHRTWLPASDEEARCARVEGWIHVPTVGPGELTSPGVGPIGTT